MVKQRATDPYWSSESPKSSFPELKKDMETDVLIIGGGMTGVSLAYQLSRAGKKVTVVEKGRLGQTGETLCTTAHLTYALDPGYHEITRLHGRQKARRVFESHWAAIRFIEEAISREKIDCDHSRLDGYLFLGASKTKKSLEEEFTALNEVGAADLDLLEYGPLDSFRGPCLRYPDQAQFHPIKYLNALTAAAQARGVEFFEHVFIHSIHRGEAITDNQNRIRAASIVVATHSPIKNIFFFLKEAAYRSYVIAGQVPKGSVPPALYWDNADPYHYVRTQPGTSTQDWLIVGGEDHKTGQPEGTKDPFEKLERWTNEHFPSFSGPHYQWSGQIIEPMDSLAFIGPSPYHKDIYIATGYSGNGLTYASIAAMLISDLIQKKENPWLEVYNPTRKSFLALPHFIEENVNMAKHMIGDWIGKGTTTSVKTLEKGEGAILKKGIVPFAVYRDDEGVVHSHSAVCPHLGCVVQWNETEKTFDCPCHGSRFNGKGEVICGPAIRELQSTDKQNGVSERMHSKKERI